MRPERAEFLDARAVEVIAAEPLAGELMRRLLARDGEHVVLRPDHDIEALLSRGRFKSGKGAHRMPGARSACHENSARLWLEDPSRRRIATGYALAEIDRVWRQHAWATQDGQILETTVEWAAYFGYELDPDEALSFATSNA